MYRERDIDIEVPSAPPRGLVGPRCLFASAEAQLT